MSRRESLRLHQEEIEREIDMRLIEKQKENAKKSTSRSQQNLNKDQAIQKQEDKLVATGFKLIFEGVSNVTSATITCNSPQTLPRLSFRILRQRSTTLEGEILHLDRFFQHIMPIHIWQEIFENLNSKIELRHEEEILTCPNSHHYSKQNEETFWRLLATLMALNLSKSKHIKDFYRTNSFQGLICKDKLKRLRPLLQIEDIANFAQKLSALWTQALIPSGVLCIDESLWKFVRRIQKLTSGDPEEVVRYIERKPAKHGVLCYQLCSFLYSDKLPYTHVILPVTTTNDYSASEACIKALEIFDAAKPRGCPSIIVCGDGAFSSAALLRAITRMGYQFCVSVNRNWHADIGEVSTASLEQFEFRHLLSSGTLFTSYRTEYSVSGNSKLLITNATNAFTVSAPSTTSSSIPSNPDVPSIEFQHFLEKYWDNENPSPASLAVFELTRHLPDPSTHFQHLTLAQLLAKNVPKKDAIDALSRCLRYEEPILPEQPTNDGNGKKRGRPPKANRGRPSSSSESVPSNDISSSTTTTSDQEHLAFIRSTTYESIEISTLPLTITRTKLLDMKVSELDSILSHLGFSGLAKLSKAGKSALLWGAQNKSNMKQQTEELKTKAKKARNVSTHDILPNLALYRDHFASVDRLDVFLSNCEAGLKHKYWRARLVERMIMVGLNNIRAVVSEDHRRCFRTAYPRRSADQFLELLVQFFLFRADQCSSGKTFFASHSTF